MGGGGRGSCTYTCVFECMVCVCGVRVVCGVWEGNEF